MFKASECLQSGARATPLALPAQLARFALPATVALLALLTSCASPPPARQAVYDFGPATAQQSSDEKEPAQLQPQKLPPVVLLDVEAQPALDGTAILYRLGYYDALQLRPYAQARWSMPAAQLLRQTLREQIGQQRGVMSPSDGGAAQTLQLRVELDEFSQLFDTVDHSAAVVRVRVTLSRTGVKGELVAQTTLAAQVPAATADAAGGARALAQASDSVAKQAAQWLSRNYPPAQ